MKKEIQSPLSRRLILYIVLCSSAITLLLTANQLYRDYQADVGIINRGFEQINNVHLKSIEATVWSTDLDKLQTQLNGISNLPDIEYVAVSEKGKTLASVGEITGSNLVSNTYPLTHMHKGQKLEIGALKVVANLDSAYFRVLDRAVVILVSNAIKTMLVATFMLLIFHLVVTRYLIEIANYIANIKLGNTFKPLELTRNKRPENKADELDFVVESINETSRRVRRAFGEVQQTQELLRESQDRLRTFMDNVPALVSLKNLDGCYLLMNNEYTKQFGISLDQGEGSNTSDLFPKEMVERFGIQEREVIDTRGKITMEHLIQHLDGQHTHLCTKFPIVDQSGQITSIGTISTDITELKNAEEDRRKALVNAEEANQAKSEFLATMSHELRTPLNAILGFSDILSNQYFGPPGAGRYREYAQDIHNSGQYLLELVNDLLDISTIEAGKQSMDKEQLDTTEILTECMKTVADKATGKGIELLINVPENFPSLYADKRATKQILLNLLSNAVKFTPEGGQITVDAKFSERDITLSIANTGEGISAKELPHLTDPFKRVEQNPYVTERGWGLGLTITKSLIEMHNGRLDIESTVGVGTMITVTMPNIRL
ncbi:MAG: ATP-binding protein [Proteobacteria bacterium]|nr:ATP-binding protein [Pseudomonadota bacterium]